MFLQLMKTKVRLLYLEGGERVSRHLYRSLFSLATFIVFWFLTFTVVRFATQYLLTQAKIGLFLYHRLLALALFVFFTIISVANILVAFATVFRNSEAEFLNTLPIKSVEIFAVKFFDSFLYSSSLMMILVLAAISGYASYFGNWLSAGIGLLVAVLPLILAAASIGGIVLLILLKTSRKLSIRTAVGAVLTLYAGSTYLYVKLNNPFTLFTAVMKYYPHIDRYLGVLDPKLDYLAPSFWSANYFYFSTTGNMIGAVASALIVCTAGIGLFLIMLKLASLFYQETFWTARHKLFERRVGSRHSGRRRSARETFRPMTLLKRDLLLFIREPSQIFHFSVLILLIGIFLFNLSAMRIYLADPFIMSSAFALIFAFNGFLVLSLAIRFVYPMLSLEGETIWLLRSSPINLGKVACTRLMPAIVLLSSIGLTLGYAAPSPFGHFHGLIPSSVIYGLACGIIFPSIVMAFGGAFVNYKEVNPVRASSSHGATVALLVSLGVLVILSSIVFSGTYRYFLSRGIIPVDLSGIWIWGVVAVFCVLIARAFSLLALKIDL